MKRMNVLVVAMALVGWAVMSGPAFAGAGEPLGVTVNGVDVSVGAGEGWTKDENDNLVTLTGSGPYVLSGTNTTDDVSFMTTVPNTVAVVSNLCLTVGDAAKRSPIEFVSDTGTNTLLIAGLGNKVKAKDDKNVGDSVKGAGILVGKGSTLVIDKAEGQTDETARLEAWGNYWGVSRRTASRLRPVSAPDTTGGPSMSRSRADGCRQSDRSIRRTISISDLCRTWSTPADFLSRSPVVRS